MLCMKKSIANNSVCAYMFMVMVGAAAGYVAARITVNYCTKSESLAGKAKKAFRTMEEKLSG